MKKELFFVKCLDEIDENLITAKQELKKCPEGILYVERRGDKTLYFRTFKENGNRKRILINRNEELVGALARRAYLETEIMLLERNRKLLLNMYDRFSEKYEPTAAENVLKHMPGKYQDLAYKMFYKESAGIHSGYFKHILISGEEIQKDKRKRIAKANDAGVVTMPIDYSRYTRGIIEWAEEPYERLAYKSEERNHTTSHGLKVRSKSELTIAERVSLNLILFRHDMIIRKDGNVLAPDFVLPDAKGDFYYWEHCGMTHDKEYMAHHKKKLEQYESIGIVPWKNLIVTYDNEYGDLDVRIIDSEIKNKLL